MMNTQTKLCALLCTCALLLAGCGNGTRTQNNSSEDTTEATYTQIVADMNQSASYGDMTVTVTSAEDPGMTIEESGKKAIFFKLTIENGTEETVTASYLNNFELTINGKTYEAYQCCTIPAMKALYDFYGVDALNENVKAGESVTGYLAVEADQSFSTLELHYIPKTTDRGSRISVPISSDEIVQISK